MTVINLGFILWWGRPINFLPYNTIDIGYFCEA
jgi:hypothetical protein